METLVLAPNEKRCSKCKEVKDRSEFYKELKNRDGFCFQCKTCKSLMKYNREKPKKLKKDPTSIECPICKRLCSKLAAHSVKAHGFGKTELLSFGNITLQSKEQQLRRKIINANTGIKFVKDEARLRSRGIFLPKKYFPSDCDYIRVFVEKDKLRVSFNPINKKLKNSRKIQIKNTNTVFIRINNLLKDGLETLRPIYELRNRSGFYIQFFEDDFAILELFQYWNKSKGRSLDNTSSLTIYSYPTVTLADHLWPLNAEYVYPEWNQATRKNGVNYIDLLPVSRTGFIVGVNKLDSKQYIGLKGCLKISRVKSRLRAQMVSFIKENNIPASDWDLKEVLPSGALRFVLSEAKAMPTIKQPKPKDLDAPKEIMRPEGTFEDWLTEIGYNEQEAG